jgi:hypothetical protein
MPVLYMWILKIGFQKELWISKDLDPEGTRISVSLTLNFSVYYTFYKNECTFVGTVLQQPFFSKVYKLQFLCGLFDIEILFLFPEFRLK